jgi:hypothetical protein
VLYGGTVRKLPVRPQMRAYAILGITDDGRTVTGNEYDPSPVGDPGRKTGRAVTWACG